MKKQLLTALLSLTMLAGLLAPALAYETADFSDVPETHWAYEYVMRMADAGVIKGTGEGKFSPDMKLSAQMFVTLVGRVVFPDVTAEGADWSGPYVQAARQTGLLTGTTVTEENITGEITRYDMAVILKGCMKALGVEPERAAQSAVTDFGDVPAQYTDAVLAAYGSGLITGDQTGSFLGANTMSRAEAAAVLDRLIGLAEANAKPEEPEKPDEKEDPDETQQPDTPPAPEQPEEIIPETPRTGETVTFTVWGKLHDSALEIKQAGITIRFFYKDGRQLGETVTDAEGNWTMDITVDTADYHLREKVYYVTVDPFEYEGVHYVDSRSKNPFLEDLSAVSYNMPWSIGIIDRDLLNQAG